MATDNTHLPQNDTVSGSENQEFNPEVVQIAQADAGAAATGAQAPAGNGAQPAPIPGVPNGEVQVQIPAGQTVVRVQIAPGETIDLPFDGALAAKFGEQGNLAVKVGDQTIILLGYAEANQQEGVTLKDAKGHAVDVATVVAQTDPNLDIQTAAGPSAGPAGQGGHLFLGFNPGAGLGGFGELNVIDPTQLQYGLIQPDETILVHDEAPTITIISIENGGVVNEDDFHHSHRGEVVTEVVVSGGDENGASQGLQDQLGGDSKFTFVQFGNYQNGNDPYDTNDHEDGSQNNPALPDDGTDSHGHALDQDREPLSSTAHIGVNFHNGSGGTLTFDHNGDTPLIDILTAKGITSHGNPLSYELLPATATHGESIVAYYTQGEGEGATQVVVFSLEIQQPTGTSNGAFDITFTIYGALDNTGQGIGLDSFELDTIFFANANGGLTTESNGALVFQDIDDVPELGHYTYSTGNGDDSGSPTNGVDTAVHYDPTNLTIGLDETPGVQHTQYDRDLGTTDHGNIDPAGSLGQHTSQHTDDVSGQHAWHIEHHVQTTINDILSQPADPANNDLTYQQGVLANLGLTPGDTFHAQAMGAASSFLDVSFGADGKAEGDVQAGKTLFAHDGNANATAFQLYMQVGAVADGHPVDSHLTNVWIDVDNGHGGFTREQVTAYQLDANTIIGIAPAPEGTQEVPSLDRVTTESEVQNGGIPVFEIHLDPITGELSVVQYHSVENPGSGSNDPLDILTDDGQPLVQFRATDYDGDHVDAPLEVAIIDDAPQICKVTYCSDGTNDHAKGHVDEDYLSASTNNGNAGNKDHDTSPDNADSTYGHNGHNDGDGPGHTHVTGQIQVQNGVDTPLTFGFTVPGLDADHPSLASFTDANGNVVKSTDGNDVSLTLTQSGNDWIITGSDSGTAQPVFTVTLDSLTGSFTFDLQGSLQHPDHGAPGSSYEDNLNLNFGVQVKDSDGDTSGGNLSFVVDDDAPKVNLCLIDCAHVMVDETLGVQTDHGANDQHGSVPSIFHGLSSTPALSWAQSSGAVVSTAGTSYGADGPGTTVMTLHTKVDGVDSGLTTDSGQHIYLYQDGDIVVGKVGDASGPVAFAVALDTSTDQMTLVQYIALHNPEATNPNDVVSIANDALQVTLSVTDGDGDTRSQNVSVGGAVEFRDDGPIAHDDYATLNETLPTWLDLDHNPHLVTGNVVLGLTDDGILSHDIGGRDQLSVDHNHTITQMVYGDTTMKIDFATNMVTSTVGGTDATHVAYNPATGHLSFDTPYGHLDIVVKSGESNDPTLLNAFDKNALGYYEYTGAHNAIDTYYGVHQKGDGSTTLPTGANDGENITQLENSFGAVTLGNSNGDQWSYKEVTVDGKTYAGLGVAGGIDGGEADTNFGHAEQITLGLPTPVNNATVTLGAFFDGDVFDNGHLEVARWEAIDADGNVVGTGVVTGDHNGLVDIDIQTTQDFTSIRLTPLDDGAGNTGDNSDFLVVGVNTCKQVDVNETFNYTLTDADGDSSSANLHIGVVDATPSITIDNTTTTNVTVDEDGLPGGNQNNVTTAQGSGDEVGGHNSASEATYAGGVFKYNPGADGFQTLTLNSISDLKTVNGTSIIFAWDEATHQLIGYEAGDSSKVAILVTLDHLSGASDFSGGFNFTVELKEPLQHSVSGTEDDLGLDIKVQVEDKDCDVVVGNIHVTINDDMPTITPVSCPNLVQNGSFEDLGTEDGGTLDRGNWGVFSAIPGWTSGAAVNASQAGIEIQNGAVVTASDGHNYVELDSDSLNPGDQRPADTNAYIAQAVHGTVTDQSYILSFDYQPRVHDAGTDTNDIAVFWNGVQIATLSGSGTGWEHFSFVVPGGVSDTSQLMFMAEGTADTLGGFLDNVSVCGCAVVDEDDLRTADGASFNGTDPVPESLSVTASTGVNFGADGAAAFGHGYSNVAATQPLTSEGKTIQYSVDSNGVVHGYVVESNNSHHDVFTINFSGGNYTFTLLDHIDHAPGQGQNIDAITFNFTATDGDGDSVNGTFGVKVVDDVPTAQIAATGTGVLIDETPFVQSNSDDKFSIDFNHKLTGLSDHLPIGYAQSSGAVISTAGSVYGADGPGSTHTSLGVSTAGADSGLLALNGQHIYLYEENGLVVGRIGDGDHADASGTVAFALQLEDNGKLDVAQFEPINQPNTSNPDDSVHIADGALIAKVDVTDYDGDVSTSSVDIGGAVTFRDDGPSLVLLPNLTFLAIDETPGPQPLTNDHIGGSDPFGGQFGSPLEWGTSGGAMVSIVPFVSNFGTDGPAAQNSLTYGLNVTNATSGLNDTATGQPIALSELPDGTVVGKVSGGPSDGSVAFAIKVNGDGSVTVAEYRAIEHPNHSSPNDSDSLNPGALSIVVTGTDGDGDSVSKSVDIGGKIIFKDDGPTVSVLAASDATTVMTTADALKGASDTSVGHFGLLFSNTPSYGTDGPGNTVMSYALNISHPPQGHALLDSGLSSHGNEIYLVEVAGVVYGTTSTTGAVDAAHVVFTLSVNSGSGDVTLTQLEQLDHAAGGPSPDYASQITSLADHLVSLTGTATTTDGDGDKATNAASIDLGGNVQFTDDGPSVTVSVTQAAEPTLLTHDAATIGGGHETVTADFSVMFSTTPVYGADGAGNTATSYGLSLQNTVSGLTSDGEAIVLSISGGVVTGMTTGGETVFTLSIDSTTGVVTLTQDHAIDHAGPGDTSNYAAELASLPTGLVTVTATATTTDFDGDKATNSAAVDLGNHVQFADDGPSVTGADGSTSLAVDETHLNVPSTAVDVAPLFTTSFGADGPATSSSLTYALTAAGGASFGSTTGTGTDSGLKTTDGHEIYLFQNGSGEIDGRTGDSLDAPLAFTVTLNGSTVTLDQMLALQHNDPTNPNDAATLNNIVHVTATATDSDGDTGQATDTNGLSLTFYDDGPTITPAAVTDTLFVDETNLNTPSTIVDVANLFTTAFGADGPAAAPTSSATPLTYVLTTAAGESFGTAAGSGTDSGLKTTDGHEIYLFQNGSHEIDGRVGNDPSGALAFTVTINGSKVTLDQLVALQHSDATDPNDPATLSGIVHVTATVTDGDNDQAHVTDANGLSLTFYDDGPTITANNAQGGVSVDETHLNTPGQSFTLSTLFTTSFGADGPASSSPQTYALTDAGGHAFSSTVGQGVDSGLKTTAGAEIYLFQNGAGEVDGRVGNDPSGTLAFKVSVSVGELELQQMVALHHNNPADPDDAVTLNGIIHVTATATDGDGDHANATDTNGLNLTFHDDGPTAALAAVANTHVTIDESVNNQADDHSGTAPFNAAYGVPLAWGTNGTAVVSTSGSAYGADGAGTTVLGLKPGSAGADSGLIDTATGQHIYLYQGANDGEVIGRVGSGGVANANGPIAVAVSINSDGTLNVAEYSALQHPNTSSANEGVSITDSSLVATVTVTDGDGDTQTATANIGSHASFLDDGPTANSDIGGTAILNTAITGNVLANDSTGADHVAGYDHGKALSVSITVGQQVYNFSADNQPHVIAGVGSFSMDDKGNWSFTQTGFQGGSDLTVHYTMEDGDHDTAASTLDIPLKTATPPTFTSVTATVDEDGLVNGNNPNLTTAQGNGDVVGGKNSSSEAVWHDSLSDLNWHGDVGTLKLAGTPSNFSNIKDLGGHAVDTVTVSSDGHTLTASAQGVNLVSVTIDNNGNYSVTLLNPVQQPTAGTEDSVTASIGINATNAAGQGFAGLTITINDDTPTAANDAFGNYAENSGAHDVGVAKTVLVDSNDHPGADGYQAGSLQIIGAGDKGGSLTIDVNGHLIYTPAASVNNPGGAAVTETFTYQYKDGDGDIATAHVTFGVTDTIPTVNVSQATATVDEDALSGGNPGGTGDHAIDATHNVPTENIWKGQIDFSYGNDNSGGQKNIALSTTGALAGALTKLDGTAIHTTWDNSTHTLTGYGSTTSDVVFTIVITDQSTGAYTLTLAQPVKHPGSNEDNVSFGVNITVTDSDGSTANGGMTVTVNDDTPTAANDAFGNYAENSGAHDVGVAKTVLVDSNDHPGADGYQAGSLQIIGAGDKGGSLTIDVNGHLIYTPAASVNNPGGAAVTETFTYQYKDGDGDIATAHVTFGVTDTIPTVNVSQATATVDEDALSGGNPGGTGDHAIDATHNVPTENIWKGQFAFSYGNDTSGASKDIALSTAASTGLTKLDGTAIQTFWDSSTHTLTGFGTSHADVVFTIVVTNTNTGDYTVTLDQPIKHAAGSNENDASFDVNIQVTDGDGSTANGSLHVVVNDDTPIATNDGNFAVSTLNLNSTPEISHDAGSGLLANDHPGADGGTITSVHFDQGAAGNIDHTLSSGPNGSTTFAIDGGNLTVNANGSWSYDQTAPITSAKTDTFSYTLTDGDGDTTTATFSITPMVHSNVPAALNDVATVPSSVAGSTPSNNVLLVLDLSTSMDAIVTGNQSRLDIEKTALVSLLTQYQNQAGNVSLQIETFGLSAATNGITYSSNGAAGHTLQDAINYVNTFTNNSLSSGTNYDAAIGGSHADTQVAGSAYNIVSNWPASSSSVSNTVYFISDGLPQSGNGSGASAGAGYLISGQQQTDWDNLLASKGATAYAIGIDLGGNPTTYLQQVADPNDSTHVITTGSVNLGTVLTGISPVTSTVSGNVLYNDKDGGDGYHTTNPILSFTHFGHTYDLTAVVGQFGVQSLTGHDMVIQTHDGGVLDINFDTGAYTYTAPSTPIDETETFTYTIADALGGDTSTATLTINVAGSGPAAYDNVDQALVTTTTVHHDPIVTATTKTDFGGTGWSFTTSGGNDNVDTPSGSNPAQSVSDQHWGVVNGGNGSSVAVTNSHLEVSDASGSGATTVATPGFTPAVGSTASLSFDLATSNTGGNNGSTTWTLYKLSGSNWVDAGLSSSSSGSTVTVNGLNGGTEYRLLVSVTDGSSQNGNRVATLDNVILTTSTPQADTQQTTITPATGNVLTDPMNNPNSLDPWNGADIVAGAALAIFNGLTFVDAAAAGTTVTGNYGTLDIHSDGSYTYQPTNASSAGHTDTFTYQLHQADGGVDTATLTVSTGTAALAATQVHQGDGTITAVTGDQVIMGHGGADTLDAHGLSTGVHLEGGAGNDHLIGGAGNDFLIGGDGNDTMEGHGGFNQYAGGTGNDTIIIDPTSTDLSSSSRHIDGGSGYDTLDLSKLATADLTGAAHTGITSIEAISLNGGSGTAVTLDAQSVLDISSNHTLVISGESTDTVNLKGSTWTAGETQIANGGHTYDAYTSTAGGNTSTVLVEHDTNVQVHLNTV